MAQFYAALGAPGTALSPCHHDVSGKPQAPLQAFPGPNALLLPLLLPPPPLPPPPPLLLLLLSWAVSRPILHHPQGLLEADAPNALLLLLLLGCVSAHLARRPTGNCSPALDALDTDFLRSP
jgi:hypothetical protein